MGASGSLNYYLNSGSHFVADPSQVGVLRVEFHKTTVDFQRIETETITEQLTVKYFQRVYDDGTAGYCYYTKTTIDPTPSAGETTPNYTGTISDHSVVKILEIY